MCRGRRAGGCGFDVTHHGTVLGGDGNIDGGGGTGGGNTLTLESGYSFTGDVVSTSGVGSSAVNGGDTLALGGIRRWDHGQGWDAATG
jgi:hypothetical protein